MIFIFTTHFIVRLTLILNYFFKQIEKRQLLEFFITSNQVVIIYSKLEKYQQDGLYIEPIEYLYEAVNITDEDEEKNEYLIGMTTGEFKQKFAKDYSISRKR